MAEQNVVLLVDNKQRDLLADALIAHHLQKRGIRCHLEPLESYQGCLAAFRPEMIIFNHLTASHLAAYSNRLADMGVLTAVLTNEGIMYEKEVLKLILGSHHADAHADLFLCWHGEMKKTMEELGFHHKTKIELVGVPRFDFYCHPWSWMFQARQPAPRTKPQVLVCTNFALADYRAVPDAAEVFFALLKDRIPIYKNYKELIEINYQSRLRLLEFLNETVRTKQWQVILRPHPIEQLGEYATWHQQLPPDVRANVVLDNSTNITRLILDADLLVTCETCTTALEAWIAGKPTIELVFSKHPVFYHPELSCKQPVCERPELLPALITEAIAHPEQKEFQAARREHLLKWCHTKDGNSCELAADAIARALKNKPPADWSKLTFADHRRAAKLKLMARLGEAYHYKPLLSLQGKLMPGKYALKDFAYRKSIKPGDVAMALAKIRECLEATAT
jgi:surface carbohydrate biosynthesis protein